MSRIVEDLKDESEPYRKMVMETVDKVVRKLGTADIDKNLRDSLMDGMIYAYQEQASFLRCFAALAAVAAADALMMLNSQAACAVERTKVPASSRRRKHAANSLTLLPPQFPTRVIALLHHPYVTPTICDYAIALTPVAGRCLAGVRRLLRPAQRLQHHPDCAGGRREGLPGANRGAGQMAPQQQELKDP